MAGVGGSLQKAQLSRPSCEGTGQARGGSSSLVGQQQQGLMKACPGGWPWSLGETRVVVGGGLASAPGVWSLSEEFGSAQKPLVSTRL